MIRLVCTDRDAPIKLDFGREFGDRDAIRDVLNRLQSSGPNAVRAPTTAGVASASGSATNGAGAVPAPGPPPKPMTPKEREWREKLLAHKDVRRLHGRLVRMTGVSVISDDMFWEGMRYKFKPNGERRPNTGTAADESDDGDVDGGVGARTGVPSDAYSTAADAGLDTTKWANTIPNPAERHQVFMRYPAVARALNAKVPKDMSEEKFWSFFLQSSMATRRGKDARMSKIAAASANEAETVFTEFQARETAQLETDLQARAAGLSTDIDLDRFDDHRTPHVLEGHAMGGEAPRPLKRHRGHALAESSNLTLMRQINRHGQLIVDESTLGSGKNSTAPVSWQPEDEDRGRPLEDLMAHTDPEYAKLGIARSSSLRQPGARGDSLASAGTTDGSTAASIAHTAASHLDHWSPDLVHLTMGIESAPAVLRKLLASMRP